MMPTMRVGAPSIGTARPTIDSSAPNALRQISLDRTATSSAPGSVSSRVNCRPRMRRDAEHRHQLGGDDRRVDPPRLIRRSEVDRARAVRADLLERSVALGELDELRRRDPELVEAEAWETDW